MKKIFFSFATGGKPHPTPILAGSASDLPNCHEATFFRDCLVNKCFLLLLLFYCLVGGPPIGIPSTAIDISISTGTVVTSVARDPFRTA